jgi:hypothetical protein
MGHWSPLVFSGVSKHYWKDRKSNAARDFGPHNAPPPANRSRTVPCKEGFGEKASQAQGTCDFRILMLCFRLNLFKFLYVKFSFYFTSLYFFPWKVDAVFFLILLFISDAFSKSPNYTHARLIINNLNKDIMILLILFSIKPIIKKT